MKIFLSYFARPLTNFMGSKMDQYFEYQLTNFL